LKSKLMIVLITWMLIGMLPGSPGWGAEQELVEPETGQADTFRFAVIGDYGDGSEAESDVATLVKSWDPDIIVTTGDNNYNNGSADTIDENIGQFFREFIYPYKGSYPGGGQVNRFFPSLGNHDWNTPGAQPYLDYFTLPGNERYYDFTWGPVHFFIIDSDSDEPDGNAWDSDQADWLQKQLANSDHVWKIVVMHLSPVTITLTSASSKMESPTLSMAWEEDRFTILETPWMAASYAIMVITGPCWLTLQWIKSVSNLSTAREKVLMIFNWRTPWLTRICLSCRRPPLKKAHHFLAVNMRVEGGS